MNGDLPEFLLSDIESLEKAIANQQPIDVWLDELWGSINAAQHANLISIDTANYLRQKYIWA